MRSLLGSIVNLARTPVPFVPRSGGSSLLNIGSMHSAASKEQQMLAMGSVGTLYAMIHRITTACGAVEWKLYRKAASGDPEDRTEVTSHAALDLWNQPNPWYTQNAFIEATIQHLDLTGEAPWVITRAGTGPPLEIWPIRPDRITPVPSAEKYLAGYIYSNGPDKVPLDTTEVIRMMYPNPTDPYSGLGPVQSMMVNLDLVRASGEWNRNFFQNSAEPGGIVQVDRRLGDDEFNEMRDRWSESHRGVAKAHRVAILEQAQWIERKYTQRDMEFSALRLATRDEIREALGFPKPMLGLADDVNLANAKAAEVVFGRWLVVPRCERVKVTVNTQLLPMFGGNNRPFEFDYVSPVAADREGDAALLLLQAQAAVALVAAGWNDADVLETVGLPPMEFEAPAAPPAPVMAPPDGPAPAESNAGTNGHKPGAKVPA